MTPFFRPEKSRVVSATHKRFDVSFDFIIIHRDINVTEKSPFPYWDFNYPFGTNMRNRSFHTLPIKIAAVKENIIRLTSINWRSIFMNYNFDSLVDKRRFVSHPNLWCQKHPYVINYHRYLRFSLFFFTIALYHLRRVLTPNVYELHLLLHADYGEYTRPKPKGENILYEYHHFSDP